jgi:3-dehydroquinate dehydratase
VNAVVAGLGIHGYELVVDMMASELSKKESLKPA